MWAKKEEDLDKTKIGNILSARFEKDLSKINHWRMVEELF